MRYSRVSLVDKLRHHWSRNNGPWQRHSDPHSDSSHRPMLAHFSTWYTHGSEQCWLVNMIAWGHPRGRFWSIIMITWFTSSLTMEMEVVTHANPLDCPMRWQSDHTYHHPHRFSQLAANWKSGTGNPPDRHASMVDIHIGKLLWVYCPEHAGVKGNDRADRLGGKAIITSGLRRAWSEVLRSLRHYLRAQSQGHHTNRSPGGGEVQKEEAQVIFLQRTREGHFQSDEQWNRFKENLEKASQIRGVGFSERIEAILNWTECGSHSPTLVNVITWFTHHDTCQRDHVVHTSRHLSTWSRGSHITTLVNVITWFTHHDTCQRDHVVHTSRHLSTWSRGSHITTLVNTVTLCFLYLFVELMITMNEYNFV